MLLHSKFLPQEIKSPLLATVPPHSPLEKVSNLQLRESIEKKQVVKMFELLINMYKKGFPPSSLQLVQVAKAIAEKLSEEKKQHNRIKDENFFLKPKHVNVLHSLYEGATFEKNERSFFTYQIFNCYLLFAV